jgi:hypothetical protein
MDQFCLSFRCISGDAIRPSDLWPIGYEALAEFPIGLHELALKPPSITGSSVSRGGTGLKPEVNRGNIDGRKAATGNRHR